MEAHGGCALEGDDELGAFREGLLDGDHEVEVALAVAGTGLALVAAVLLDAVNDVAANGDLAGVGRGVGAVLQRDGVITGAVGVGGGACVVARARSAEDQERVLAVGELLGAGADAVGVLVDLLGRLALVGVGAEGLGDAGRLAHGVGDDVKQLVRRVLVDGE